MNQDLLSIAMSAAIPLRIMQLKARGGPSKEDIQKAQKTSEMLGERGDVLIFGGGKKGEAAELFNRTAQAIAVLSFVPGGVTIFGQHFEANPGKEPSDGEEPIPSGSER